MLTNTLLPMHSYKSKSLVTSLRHAGRGIVLALKREKSLRWQLLALVAILALGKSMHFSPTEFALVLSASALVLAMEFMNSALEYLADVVHPTFSQGVGFAKDIAAAGVLVASVGALAMAACLFLLRFY